ncbi:DNA primase [Patescibacteria group bacterium]|nr:DNA primase [Patescibacteria group bacterium]
MDNVEEIKSKIDIVDFVSEYVQLKRSGTSFRGICPFHQEKTPSFFVSPEKQIWHCFGCSKGSDLFGFLMEIEGIDFPEALRILAQKAGVEIQRYDRQAVSQKTRLLDLTRWAAEFYNKVYWESPLAESARKYLKQRGLDKKTINDFQLGYAPDKWDTLLKFLLKRGYIEKDMEAAGLVIKRQSTINNQQSNYYDRFRNRIIFPIADLHDQVIGFTSRILPGAKDEDKIAKYINTPETLIYSKSRVLYGLNKAKIEARKQDQIILVEGNMDVLACHQAGFENVVCTSGTALTQDQIKILQRYTENIILAFDIDLAGQAATQRSIDLLLQQGLNVKVLKLEQGKDPDEFIRHDLKAWKKALEEPQEIMEYYFSLAFKDKDLSKIEHKKQISKDLLPIIIKLGDPVEKDLWLRKLGDKLNVSEISLRDALTRVKQPYLYKSVQGIPARGGSAFGGKERVPVEEQASEKFLALVLKYPEKGEEFIKKVVLDMFMMPRPQDVLRAIKDCYIKNKKIDFKKIKKEVKDKQILSYLDFLLFLAEKEFAEYEDKEIDKELNCFFSLLKKRFLTKKMENFVQELKQEEEKGDKKKIQELSLKIVKLSREIVSCQ